MPVDIAKEKVELDAAPPAQLGPFLGRCHWCGRVARTLTLVEVVGGAERYKGECCHGPSR